MLEYSQNIINNYDDTNYTHYNKTSHPKTKGIAYFDKHVQPSNDACVGSLLTNVFKILCLDKLLWILGNVKFLESGWQ